MDHLSAAEFTFVMPAHGIVKVIYHGTGEFNTRGLKREYFRITILKNGEAPKIGQPSRTDASSINKTNALRIAKELLKKS